MSRRVNETLANRYELQQLLGAGGMAEVWLGRDLVLGRTVAVKTLHTQYAGDPHFIDRFKREAQHAAQLNHPNIVSVYDTGSDDGTYYIVMEYVEGRTLRDIIREEGPLLPERVSEVGAEVCAGLAFAHGAEIIHRDVKPANIMITPSGGVKVADFGIARAASGDTVTQTAMVLGTAQYFSPEQAQSSPVDARSDVYSLGVVLYEMLTKQVPFTGSSPVAIAYKHVKEDPTPPSRLNGDVPPDLEAIVMKALAKNPDNRYQSALEMREDLLRALHGRPVEAPPVLADATGMINLGSDETVMIERARVPKGPSTDEERKRRTGIILLSAIVLAILGVAAWALAGILGAPETTRIPNVLGQRLELAEDRLEAQGFEVDLAEPIYSDRFPPGSVAQQDPEGGVLAEVGSRVTIWPSQGQELLRVPSVVGDTETDARKKIRRAGLDVGEVAFASSAELPAGRVISQDPTGNTQVEKDTKVNLTISTGPPEVEVPDVVGFSREDAERILKDDGFDVQVVEEEQGPDCAEEIDHVCDQNPNAGDEVEEGSSVTIVVAVPPDTPAPTQCNNTLDDDGDGFVDHPADPGCDTPEDDDETDPEGDGGEAIKPGNGPKDD